MHWIRGRRGNLPTANLILSPALRALSAFFQMLRSELANRSLLSWEKVSYSLFEELAGL